MKTIIALDYAVVALPWTAEIVVLEKPTNKWYKISGGEEKESFLE